jgi:hypothetical protein
MAYARRPWMCSHDTRLARGEILYYQHTFADALHVLMECIWVMMPLHLSTFYGFFCDGQAYDACLNNSHQGFVLRVPILYQIDFALRGHAPSRNAYRLLFCIVARTYSAVVLSVCRRVADVPFPLGCSEC